jgi:Mrp family chromosome partitioning ATPase/capsular polysaccharide biosynthesis protein
MVAASAIFGAALAGWIVHQLEDRYTATTLILAMPSQSTDRGGTVGLSPDDVVEILNSDEVAAELAARLDLVRAPDFTQHGVRVPLSHTVRTPQSSGADSEPPPHPGNESSLPAEAVIRLVHQRVAISRRGVTNVIAIEASSANPKRAAEIANAYATVYLERQIAAKKRSLDAEIDAVQKRSMELREILQQPAPPPNARQEYLDTLTRLDAIAQLRKTIAPDATVVATAYPTEHPTFPPRMGLIALGFLIGSGGAIGLAMLREIHGGSIETDCDLADATGLATLGLIPAVKHTKLAAPQDLVTRRPFCSYSQAIQRLCIKLCLTKQDASLATTILLTSVQPGDGKTTIAVSLARAAAAHRLEVVLIDCDPRFAGVHSRLGLPNKSGPANLTTSEATGFNMSLLSSDPDSGFKLITSSANRPSCGQHSEVAPNTPALRELQTHFDLVLLDGPALALSADALLLGACVDKILLVARAGRTSLRNAQRAVDELATVDISKVVSIVNFANCQTGYSTSWYGKWRSHRRGARGERRLLKGIVNPSMLLVFLTGIALALLTGYWQAAW